MAITYKIISIYLSIYLYIYICVIWIMHMVNKGNHPQMAQHFRLVKYYNSPIYIYIYIISRGIPLIYNYLVGGS